MEPVRAAHEPDRHPADRGGARACAPTRRGGSPSGSSRSCSRVPCRRAYDTAKLAGLADDAEVTEDLVEFGYGEYEGRTTPEIREERPGWNLWTHGTPGGEDLADASARVDRVIERAVAADGDVAMFGHGHILRIVGARWAGLPPETAAVLALSTAALCILGFERERRVIWLWNDTSHAT